MIYGPNDALPDLPLDPPDDDRLTAEELQQLREDETEARGQESGVRSQESEGKPPTAYQ